MSSSAIKCAGNEEELSLEKKACLDGIMKKAELLVESEEVQKKCLAVVAGNSNIRVAGALWNETIGPLTLVKIYIYKGSIVTAFPNTLSVGVEGDFVMTGSDGVEAVVVVYSGKNKEGVQCAWSVFFDAESYAGPEVYVMCRPMENFEEVNKDEIKKKIKRDGKNSYYTDVGVLQSTSMYAKIIETSPGSGNYALVAGYYVY